MNLFSEPIFLVTKVSVFMYMIQVKVCEIRTALENSTLCKLCNSWGKCRWLSPAWKQKSRKETKRVELIMHTL